MSKPRKMLGAADSPYIISLMRLIETQSKATIATWCLDCAEAQFLPIFERHCPEDPRPRHTISAARALVAGETTLKEVKDIILHDCRDVARTLDENPVAQAAVRACGQATACFHTPTHSLGMAFYGAAAIAYDRVGLTESPQVYDQIAAEECAKMEAALHTIAVKDEPNPAKINWGC